MADARKKKMEFILPKGQVAAFFKTLGEELQQGGAEGSPMSLEGYREIKISIQDQGAALLVGLKAKFPKPDEILLSGIAPLADLVERDDEGELTETGVDQAEVTAGPGLPKYKVLKKRMRQTFKSLAASLAAGTPPPAEVLDLFAADSRLMCAFPGLGDEFYPPYLELVDRLVAQIQAGDAESLRQALDTAGAINQMKKDCHARHK